MVPLQEKVRMKKSGINTVQTDYSCCHAEAAWKSRARPLDIVILIQQLYPDNSNIMIS